MTKEYVEDKRIYKGGKTLYHIQNMNICSDGEPYDMFVFLEHEPTKEDLKNIWINFDNNGEEDPDGLDEFVSTSRWWAVWGDEL